MTIHLPEDLERFVQMKVRSGRFTSEDEAIGEAVRLLRQQEEAKAVELPQQSPANQSRVEAPSWQRVLDIMGELPDAVFDPMPADSSEHLDHYLYGTPKRTNS